MKRILIFLILCLPLRAAVVTIEADDCNVGQSMHDYGDVKLWRATYMHEDVNLVLAHCYDAICAVESSHPDLPLGNNVIGDCSPISGHLEDYWYSNGPFLFLEIHGFAKKLTVSSVSKPGTINKVLVVKFFDANGVTVAYMFDTRTTLVIDMGDYKAVYGFIYPGAVRSIDHIVIDYQPIPPPDFATFIDYWLCECSIPNLWCEGSDVNHDMIVNFMDYARLFLEGCP